MSLVPRLRNLCSTVSWKEKSQWGNLRKLSYSTLTRHSDTRSVIFFPHWAILQFSVDTSWVSYNSTHFWHHRPGVSVRLHRLRAQSRETVPAVSANSQVPGLPHFWPSGYKSGFPMTPSTGSVIFKNGSQNSEMHFTYVYQFIVKYTAAK